MKALIIGSGGREYTLGQKLNESKKITKIYFAPGNGGTAGIGENIKISPTDFETIQNFIKKNNIELLIVGPEDPLVQGLVDFLQQKNISDLMIIGPSKQGALLEGSKTYAKEFMQKYNIPTAAYKSFNNNQFDEAVEFMQTLSAPYVLKADGLAAGKGVLILDSLEQAKTELRKMFDGKFGNQNTSVVIEQFLDGIELSVFVITDGENYKILPEAKDYKRIGEADTGLNTGGMGAVSPVPFANNAFKQKIEQKIIIPTIKGLKNEKIDYKGFIFFGLIKVNDEPYVIEYNVRMGDPETQAVIPRIKTDFFDIYSAIHNKTIDKINLEIEKDFAVSVVLTSGGYPENYEKNKEITGIKNAQNALVIHAGTTIDADKKLKTSGGRVLTITAFGKDIQDARQKVYNEIKNITFDKMYYRKDIGLDLI